MRHMSGVKFMLIYISVVVTLSLFIQFTLGVTQ